MRKKIIFIIIMSIFLFIPISTKAASVSVGLSCPTSASVGETISCKVSVTSDVLVTGLAGKYSLGNSFTYVSFTPSNGFTTYSDSSSGFAIGNNTGIKGSNKVVGTIKLKIKSAGTFTLQNLDASDNNYNSYSPTKKTASIRIKSSNTNLGSLSLSNGTLSPTFNAATTNYKATINATSVTINATRGDSYQKVSGIGNKALNYGANTFKVVVTAENGATKTYTIVITRPDNRSTNNNLKTLSVSEGTLTFNKNTTTYNLNVESNIKTLKIDAFLEDSKASFASGYGPRTINLNYGKNVAQIRVKAENGTVKTYTININRKDNRSTNNYLQGITLSSGEILFDKNTLEYNMTVLYDVTKINVVATPEDAKSKVVVNSPNLVVGNNIITIVVTSENVQTRTYKINVKRLSEAEKPSENNNVKSFVIKGHDIDFKNDVYDYEITIGDEYALVFDVTLEDQKAKYVITGNEDLKDGNIIKLIVTSESGDNKEYSFKVTKKEVVCEKQNKCNDSKNLLMGGIIGLALGILLTSIVITLTKKKSKNNQEPTTVTNEESISENSNNIHDDMHDSIIEENNSNNM